MRLRLDDMARQRDLDRKEFELPPVLCNRCGKLRMWQSPAQAQAIISPNS